MGTPVSGFRESPSAGRTLVMGDWGPVVRDPIDLLRATFFVGAAYFLVTGQLSGTGNLVVGGAALVFTGWGEALGLYDLWKPYDNVVHVIVPMLCCQVAYIALARIEVLPDLRDDFVPRHYAGIFTVAFSLGVAIGGVWEIVEWTSDAVFGSNLSMGNDDTVSDLVSDTVGAALGGLLLVAWTKYGWGSVRRIPGESRREDVDA